MMNNLFIFPFNPQTHVRVTRGDSLWMRIPEECPHKCGQPRRKKPKDDGCPHSLSQDSLNRKRRILEYYAYKETLLAYALQKRFVFPQSGAALYFFVPIPVRRPRRERERLHMTGHWQQKPDLDNYVKAFFDGIMPGTDHRVYQLSGLGKYWVDTIEGATMKDSKINSGWIEVHTGLPVYNPLTRLYETENPLMPYDQVPKTPVFKAITQSLYEKK